MMSEMHNLCMVHAAACVVQREWGNPAFIFAAAATAPVSFQGNFLAIILWSSNQIFSSQKGKAVKFLIKVIMQW